MTMHPRVKAVLLFLVFVVPLTAHGQIVLTEADYARAESMLATNTRTSTYHTSVSPTWLAEDQFWFAANRRTGTEYTLVDPRAGTTAPLFDHGQLAESLQRLLDDAVSAGTLNLNDLNVTQDSLTFVRGRRHFACNRAVTACRDRPAPVQASGIVRSPDGKLGAFRRNHNLWVIDLETQQERQLTHDGVEHFGYATNNAGWVRSERPVVLWSPDSRKIATFQHDGRGVGEMYMVSTEIGHPSLEAWKYPLPQDSVVFMIHRVVVHVDDARTVRLDMAPDFHRGTTTDHIAGWDGTFLDVRWSPDASKLAFVSSSRDHKDAWLRVADPETGAVREVLHEHVPTYFESGVDAENWDVLFETDEVLWYSERTNWGHLYLYDLQTGALKHQITTGDWAVQQVRRLDTDHRVVYFTGAGRDGPDPYYQYLYRVDLDGSALALLTPEPANHVTTIAPSGTYFVDTWSTPTTPQRHAVRQMDGDITVDLGEADISELLDEGWKPPTPFTVKARDGDTDLFGLMYLPTDFDASQRYPVVNYLYPGPQSGSVGTRSFLPARGDKQALAELGFVVVEVDAMGTPGRSKSFHDAYYGNMGDNGLPDQITTIRQLGAQHEWMDLERVGIWGHSGGGFAAAGAILRYPEFYKVAVSGAGNHDNRIYEDDWGEKWHGLLEVNPDGTTNYDSQSNIPLAANLRGKLLLAHGLMDDNVPAGNTLALVDALVAANKDFDLVVFPNGNHGFGSGRTYWMRKRWDYFVQHLLGATPPKEFEFGRVRLNRPAG